MEGENPNDVLIKINAILKEAQPLLTDECCIYRVPHEIRKFKEDAYTPKVVSIGPFHHGDPKLLKMEGLKRTCCREFIERSETKNLKSFVSCVQELEAKVRGCYSDEIKLSEEEHVMVILVDCCFILEFLLRHHFKLPYSDDIFLSPRLGTYIRYDLLMLENQVPFFVLEKLYNLAFPSTLNSGGHESHPSLLRLALRYIVPSRIVPCDNNNDELTLVDVGRIAHFTDLTRKSLLRSSHLLQPSTSGCSREAKLTQLYSATELNEAGVKFEVHKASQCLLDLELSVFDFLINTEKDVDFFVKNGIIENWIGDSNAVAEMFNGLGVNVVHPNINTQYLRICEELNAFCNHPWNRKVATLRRDYCNTPWKTVASIAGIFLLILTIIQTVFSILQVVLA
ncbi:UPF0481 protein At3g47200 isoform X2 [Arachis duranensis]|uniref:UPF0481 protein At3g47200 isoform X2 n=1 Tax=Arachis duranensis TaxID=130453 RepID=A0A9C6TG62_ARADU|nr:UPF0481 protein At3g47200 isoform X2 [Arachis duranensis]